MLKNSYVLLLLVSFLTYSCSKEDKKVSTSSMHGLKDESYYTCTMHPQVHEHGPGNCPICGMPLVKVSSGPSSTMGKDHLLPSSYQKAVLNFTQKKVEKKQVSFKLQTAGRIMNREQVAFYIYEGDWPFVKVGQDFVGISSSSDKSIHGIITSIDHIADPSSRAIRVTGKVNSSMSLGVTEGSFFGSINSSPESVLMIPDDAVLRTGKKTVVYIVNDDGKIFPEQVTLGRSQGDEIEILSGLSEGATIVSGPNFLLDSEARLRGIDD
jgi:hypothetical protein